MPSIEELRLKCQATKVEKDYIVHTILRKISIYLTKVFLYTPISGNQVTLISVFIGVLGGFLLSLGRDWYYLIGALLYVLFIIFDLVDGEIARYRKTMGMKGDYFDYLAHFFIAASLFGFLTFGVSKNANHTAVFVLGFLAISANLIDKASSLLIYYSICMKKRGFFKLIDSGSQEEKDSKKTILSVVHFLKRTHLNKIYRVFDTNFCDVHITINLLFFSIVNLFLPPIRLLGISFNYLALFLCLYGLFYPLILIAHILEILFSNRLTKTYEELFD